MFEGFLGETHIFLCLCVAENGCIFFKNEGKGAGKEVM